jgi:uncharacterized membrane protein YkoI
MPVSRILPAVFLLGLLGVFAGPVLAAAPAEHPCLNKADQRVAVATHKAIPLAQVMKSRRAEGHHGELVRARLCQHSDGLVYVLTLLARSGRVVSATVDAANGELINSR